MASDERMLTERKVRFKIGYEIACLRQLSLEGGVVTADVGQSGV